MYVRGDVATLRNSLGAIARLADGRGVCVCVCVCVAAWDLHFGMCKVVYHHKRVKDSSLRASPNMPTCSPV